MNSPDRCDRIRHYIFKQFMKGSKMTREIKSEMYPFHTDGQLCPALDDASFLVEAYTASGYRPAIKAFCKKVKWEGKPSVGISLGTEQMEVLLKSLFNSPQAREKLNSLQHKKSKIAAPPLHQAIWNWLLAREPELAGKFEESCEQRAGGLFFLSKSGLSNLLETYDPSSTDESQVTLLLRVVLAFAMLQPDEAEALITVIVDKFPATAKKLGL